MALLKTLPAIICMILSTVVYWVVDGDVFRRRKASWTARTVDGPRLHSTVRISSSASVGRPGSLGLSDMVYEDDTTMVFVCQAEM